MQFFSSASAALVSSPLSIAVVFDSSAPAAASGLPAAGTAGAAAAAASAAGPAAAALPTYCSLDTVRGVVKLSVAGGKRVEHLGVRMELKGVVEAASGGGQEFLSLVAELCPAGSLQGLQSLPFSFAAVELPVESYSGASARVRYYVRAIVTTRGATFGGPSSERKEAEFLVRNASLQAPPPASGSGSGSSGGAAGGVDAATLAADPDAPILLEVGIEDCLHIEFQYSRTRFHLADTVTGHIDFKQLGIKLRRMEVAVVRKESVGLPGAQVSTSENLIKFEVMDGEPQVDDRIPIRVPLAALEQVLSPTIAHESLKLLTVRYYLYLALHDEQRAYFKTQEIQLWRKKEASASPFSSS